MIDVFWFVVIFITGCQINSQAPNAGGAAQPVVATTGAILVHANQSEKGNELVLRQVGERVQAQRNATAMPGIFILPSQRIVSVSTLNLQPGKENAVLIKWSDLTLNPLPIDKLLSVESDMPTMPEMGGPFPAAIVKKSATEAEATIDIAHGGYWEVKLVFDGAPKETVKIGIDIPKGRGR